MGLFFSEDKKDEYLGINPLRLPVSNGKHHATPLPNEEERGAKRLRHVAPRSVCRNPVVLVFPSLGFSNLPDHLVDD